jgi:hypothetical protein
MQITASPLLPIDGFRYETPFGYFAASFVKAPVETFNPADVQVIEIEFTPESCDACPIRRLILHVSQKDLMSDLPAVMRLITGWVLIEPSGECYYDFECHYPEGPVI